MENVIIMYSAIVLDIVLVESLFKITLKVFSFLLIWDKNLGSHSSWQVAKPLWIHPYDTVQQ